MLLDAKTVVLDDNSDDLFEIYKYLVEKLEIDTHSFQILKGSPVQHADIMFPILMFTTITKLTNTKNLIKS